MLSATVRRAPALVRSRALPSVAHQRRLASSESHGHDDHHVVSADEAQYHSKETFFTRPFLYTILAGGAIVGFYKWAPAPGEDAYITRYIAHNGVARSVWEGINRRHLAGSQSVAEEVLFIESAQKPIVHRFRYPQMMDQASTHSVPVGPTVDFSGLVVKQ